MLITDKIIYIELHKTGSSHTREIFLEMYGGGCKIAGKHASYDSVPEDILGNFEEKLKIGNIRNPWDWYVSLWAFGCQQKGGIYNYLTSDYKIKRLSKKGVKSFIKRTLKKEYPRLDHNIWNKLYSDSNDYKNFNTWLKLFLTKEGHDIGEGYKVTNLSKFAGFLTYRYLSLYTYKKELNNIKSQEELLLFDERENFMDAIIRNEDIHEDMLKLANLLQFNDHSIKNILQKFKSRTNISKRDRDYRKYYNDESIKIVQNFEKLIIDKHGYSFG